MQAIEKRNSLFNSLAQSVMNSHDANFWLQKINPLWSINQPLAKIVEKQIVAKDTVSLMLQCNRHVVRGVAGQHHPVTVDIAGRHYERTYSMMQVDADHLCLTVKKVDQGLVSSWLVEQSQAGDILRLGHPYGEMQQSVVTPHLLLLAAGSGITPMLSLIEALCQSKQLNTTTVQLMYWVKTHADAAYAEYLKEVSENFSKFSAQIFYTQEQDSRLNQSHVDQLTSLNETTVYACGPSGFAATAESLFQNAAALHTEAFSLSQFEQEQSETGFINVTLTQSNKTIAIPKGQSILTSLEHQGIKPDHGCRMGICNKCACNKVQGATKNLLNGAANNEPTQLLKICVNSAQSDLVIDL
ncbi:ferredoxin reductase [Acinetobacter colistiniresistens]|uniref:ferredoxin reductase n=1 Tax=Acinetobacter colistiniresistens TaxID=280145 RepID=UPI00211BAD37|nr:ferredoxin reductase [Acinetobacter colistiniresistens]UUM29111.1 ferredoxin reductase [Acinetobacter colistiniresistens]